MRNDRRQSNTARDFAAQNDDNEQARLECPSRARSWETRGGLKPY